MSPTLTYPGVYIGEISAGVRAIEGVPTSITAFIGRAARGPIDNPVLIESCADFDRQFGGLWALSTMSYAVRHFFENGGTDGIIVRVQNSAVAATFTLFGETGPLKLEAANAGSWSNNLAIEVDHRTKSPGNHALFNLTVREVVDGKMAAEEVFRDVSIRQEEDRCVEGILRRESDLVRVKGKLPTERPNPGPPTAKTSGGDGEDIGFAQIADGRLKPHRRGIWAFDDASIFNLLCIPPFSVDADVDTRTWIAAQAYCRKRRAMLLIDPPLSWKSPSDVMMGSDLTGPVPTRDKNSMVFFPRLQMANPLNGDEIEVFPPCGAIAGTYARMDERRGVWTAPAGAGARLINVQDLTYTMTDAENDKLNSLGVNCLRSFPDIGKIICGARTTVGANHLLSDWRYVPVRRLALYIEESIFRSLQWVVFEPNDESLWAQVRLNVGAFLCNLFRMGALRGSKPDEAYFVNCDSDTTTRTDIDRGVINVEVGFAPVRPAEFVIIRLRHVAGQIEK